MERQIDEAMAEGRDFYDDEVAMSVRYVADEDLYVVVLKSKRRVLVPREELQGVCEASGADSSEVELGPLDSSIHWPKLDIDFSVKGLADGRRGNERWMKRLAERQSPIAA